MQPRRSTKACDGQLDGQKASRMKGNGQSAPSERHGGQSWASPPASSSRLNGSTQDVVDKSSTLKQTSDIQLYAER